MKGFIYKITNRVNNKVYIGQTRFTIEHRFKQHIKNFNIEHRQQPLYMAFEKYGLDNFDVEQVEEVDIDLLDEREKYWIAYYDSFKNGYNATIGGHGGLKYVWTDNQYEEIRSLYLSGFTAEYIANLYNVSSYTIIGILRSLNVKFRNQPFNINRIEKDRVIEKYKNGASVSFIAKEFNTNIETVKRFLIRENVDLRHHSKIINNPQLHEEIINDFLSGMRYKDMEIKYNADTRTMKKILVMHGINLNSYRGLRRTTKNAFCLSDEDCLEAIKMYNDRVKVKDIAHKFKIDTSTVYELLKRYHVKCERYNRKPRVSNP